MFAGIGLAATSVLLSLYSAWRPITKASPVTSSTFAGIIILYGIMQFASSYVEEEQQFWYWTCSGWFVILALSRYTFQNYTTSSTLTFTDFVTHPARHGFEPPLLSPAHSCPFSPSASSAAGIKAGKNTLARQTSPRSSQHHSGRSSSGVAASTAPTCSSGVKSTLP